jgi:hypothetical protein
LDDRQVAGILAGKNLPAIAAGLTEWICNIASVTHQTAGRGKFTILVDGWEPKVEQQPGQPLALSIEERIGTDNNEPASSQLGQVTEDSVEVSFRLGKSGFGGADGKIDPFPGRSAYLSDCYYAYFSDEGVAAAADFTVYKRKRRLD